MLRERHHKTNFECGILTGFDRLDATITFPITELLKQSTVLVDGVQMLMQQLTWCHDY